MNKDKNGLGPIEFDGKFDGYGYFDPRAFWEKVVAKEHGSKKSKLAATEETDGNDRPSPNGEDS